MENKKYIRKRFLGLSCDPGKDTYGRSLSSIGYDVGNLYKTKDPSTLWDIAHIIFFKEKWLYV